jgi:pyruvate dehydrogenase E2 component (dihydrolipoamide acetyltransferase)
MAEFTMPSLGADMDRGTLLEWLVKPGDIVQRGDIVAVVDTSKSAVEVETFTEGVVDALLVEPGTTVAVGTPLATIEVPGAPHPAEEGSREAPSRPESHVHSPLVRRLATRLGVDLDDLTGSGRGGEITREDVTRAAETVASPSKVAAPAALSVVPRQAPTARGRSVLATPYARRLAAELGVDLASLTVPEGRPLRASDVRAAVAEPVGSVPPITPAPEQAPAADRQDRMRETIAAVMSRAKREIPHYYLSTTVDLTRALDWMHERNRGLPVSQRIVPAAMMLKATALATAATPKVNGFWVDGRFRPGQGVHLGVAVSLRGGGLIAPALHDTADLTVDGVMAGMRDLVARARSGRLRGSELSDSTLTVTNLGDQGVESVFGVIYPPQVALVGFGKVVDRACAVGGLIGVRPVTTMTLSADHRATDGFTGGRFLAAIDGYLQEPEKL